MLEKFWDINFYIKKLVVPLFLLVIYCVTFAFLSSNVFPINVNYYFVRTLKWFILICLFPVILVSLIVLPISYKKGHKIKLNFCVDKPIPSDLFLLLLPLNPIVQYILNNRDILSFSGASSVILFFTIFYGFFIFLIPMFLGFLSSPSTLKVMGLAFVCVLSYMASFSKLFSWFEWGSFLIQFALFFGVYLFMCLFYTPYKKRYLFIFLSISFFTNIGVQLYSINHSESNALQDESNHKSLSILEGKGLIRTPNIYLLVYDSYVSNETMLAHGIDNSQQENFLEDLGFILYPHNYSIGAQTLPSMGMVFNITNEIDYGAFRSGVSGDSAVHKKLKSLGYSTYGLFQTEYIFRGKKSSYDYTVPDRIYMPSNILLASAILMGEFRFDIGFETQKHEEYVEKKQRIFKSISKDRVFVYSHSNLPSHSQFIGICLDGAAELYRERLHQANIEMQSDVATIIKNDPDSIIIVAGDHGPYLSKSCDTTTGIYDASEISRLDIQDRYGSFLAIRWPSEDFERYDEIKVLQDLFPVMFAYLYNDHSILGLKIDPEIAIHNRISGVTVNNGTIKGGINDGEPLFLNVYK